MKNKYLLILIFFILTQVDCLLAQDPLLRHYTTNDELPGTLIYSMIQDKDGFIWFGTDAGVTRFDGIKFQNYTVSDGLSDNDILLVRIDSKDRIWFLGFNGTVSYWLNGKIYNTNSDTLLQHITATNSFIDLYEDNSKKLWFISLDGYVVLDQNKISSFEETPLGQPGVIANYKSGPIFGGFGAYLFHKNVTWKKRAFNLQYFPRWFSRYLPLSDGSILFSSLEGVVWQEDTVQKLILPFQGAFKGNVLSSLALSKDSLLWFTALGKGLYCYDLKNPLKNPEIYLKHKLTSNVLADREGNIWISTINDGLYMIPVWGKKVIVYNKENGLPSNQCFSINKLKTAELLVGMDKGKVNLISNSKIFDFKTYECPNPNNRVFRIHSYNDDIWIATEYGLLHQNNKTGCNHLINDPDHFNWHSDGARLNRIMWNRDIALGDSNIYIVNLEAKFKYPIKCPKNTEDTAERIRVNIDSKNYCIYYDHSGQIWYGTTKGLRYVKDGAHLDPSEENVLLTNRINSIAETQDSTLILATNGFGVLLYKNGKVVNRITSAQGLCNDICNRIFVHKDQIYVCTPSGLSVLFYSKGVIQSIQNLSTGNFLPSNQVYDVFADDEDISVATMKGVAVISQEVFKKIKPIIPLLSITEIRVNDSLISLEGEHNYSYKQNSLKVSFIGINFQRPNEVNYRYKLKDNQSWNNTENTKLEFSFLPPGNYNFQIQARVQNGNWSPVQSFSFMISPPFWNTIWFRLIILVAIILLAYFIVKRRLKINRKKQEEKAKIEKQIAGLEQQALQTMMNPHFIFNVMNSIQHFINSNDNEAANNYLTDFATLIRMNLSISYKKFVPLDEEINYLNLYLKFEKLRFGDMLTYEINVDPAIDASDITVAVMMIQPFIENAVWHGILPMNEKGHIHIQIDKAADNLIKIRVEDNGVGISEKFITGNFLSQPNGSHALSMTMQRLNLLEKSAGHKLYIRYKHLYAERKNKGTIAELLLPVLAY